MDTNPNAARLHRWLRPLLFPYNAGDPTVATLEVKHVNANNKYSSIRKLPVQAEAVKDEGDDYLKRLVTELEECCQDDADGMGGTQAYVVEAASADGEHKTRTTLRVRAVLGEEEGDELATEPATAKGLVTQLMRHNNNAERIAVGATGTVIMAQQRMINRLVETNEKLSTKALEVMELRERLMNEQHVRDLELEDERAKQRRKDRFLEHAINALGPTVKGVLKAVGMDGGGAAEGADVMTVKNLANSLDEQQLAAFKKILSPMQFFALLSVLESAQGAKEGNGELVANVKPLERDETPDEGTNSNGSGEAH